MPLFFGIAPGETIAAAGVRISVPDAGDRVYMHGKWLDLGEDHAVVVYKGPAQFIREDGAQRRNGDFPGWLVRGAGKSPLLALMFNWKQFAGGSVHFIDHLGVLRVGVFPSHGAVRYGRLSKEAAHGEDNVRGIAGA